MLRGNVTLAVHHRHHLAVLMTIDAKYYMVLVT